MILVAHKRAAMHVSLAEAICTGGELSSRTLIPTCGIALLGKDVIRQPHAFARAEVSSAIS